MTPIAEESLKFHYEKKGKIEVVSTVQVGTPTISPWPIPPAWPSPAWRSRRTWTRAMS